MVATADEGTVLRRLRVPSTPSNGQIGPHSSGSSAEEPDLDPVQSAQRTYVMSQRPLTSSCLRAASLLRSGRPYRHARSPRRRAYGSYGWMRNRNVALVNPIVRMRVLSWDVNHRAVRDYRSVVSAEASSRRSVALNRNCTIFGISTFAAVPRQTERMKGNVMRCMIPWMIFSGAKGTALMPSMNPSHDCRQWMVGHKPSARGDV
jgi:hypothetical protein